MRILWILLLVVIPSLALFNVIGEASSQNSSISLSTTTEFSIMNLGTTTLAEFTTSSFGLATGFIPGTQAPPYAPPVCFYVPYGFHVDSSTKRIIGTISGDNPFNFYLMSKLQYDAFVLANPSCGSSYYALKLDYAIRTFNLDWAVPPPGDYYILLENTSKSFVTYTIQIYSIRPSSSAIFSTMAVMQTLTFTQQVATTASMQTASAVKSAGVDLNIPIAVALVLIVAAVLLLRIKRSKLGHRFLSSSSKPKSVVVYE